MEGNRNISQVGLIAAKSIAIIFAGGVGQRMGNGDSLPKQFLKVYDKPIIIHTIEQFQKNDNIDKIYIAIHKDYLTYMTELVEYYHLFKVSGIVAGGKTGQDSIYKALTLAKSENDENSIVLIHDGVRPNISDNTVNNVIASVERYGNGITATSCFETILVSESSHTADSVPYRKHTFAAQAPQGFFLKDIYEAHNNVRQTNPDYEDLVDSCTLFKSLDKEVYLIEGNRGNIKVTTIEDLYILRALLRFKEDKENIIK